MTQGRELANVKSQIVCPTAYGPVSTPTVPSPNHITGVNPNMCLLMAPEPQTLHLPRY